MNLLSNAVKFTDQGEVRLRVSAIEAVLDGRVQLRFDVRDTGIGMTREVQTRIFRAFEQADSGHARRFGGTGLGTTIAKSLTELLGGRISVESEEGRGSLFRVEMPLTVVPDAALVAEEEGVSSSENVIAFDDPFLRHRARMRSLRILVADDQSANVTVLQRILEKAGHSSVAVNSGEDVLDALAVEYFDAVIIDLHMPGLSGIEVLKHARVMQAGRRDQTPFIVLTADVTTDTVRECQDCGARSVLSKPVSVPRLLDMLAEIGQPAGDQVKRQTMSAPVPQISFGDSIISSQVLAEMADLGEGFIAMFVDECIRDALNCIAELEKAGVAGQWDNFRDQCHALKGVAGNIGAVRLSSTAASAMQLSNFQYPKEWRRSVQQLREQLEKARSTLKASAVTTTRDESRPELRS
jgi:two-component system sensor histidine kinase RpfC